MCEVWCLGRLAGDRGRTDDELWSGFLSVSCYLTHTHTHTYRDLSGWATDWHFKNKKAFALFRGWFLSSVHMLRRFRLNCWRDSRPRRRVNDRQTVSFRNIFYISQSIKLLSDVLRYFLSYSTDAAATFTVSDNTKKKKIPWDIAAIIYHFIIRLCLMTLW